MTHYVYILRCMGKRKNQPYEYFYTGLTNNPKRRFWQHKNGRAKATKRYGGNVIMVYLEEINAKGGLTAHQLAWRREKQIKSWSKARKSKLIQLKQKRSNLLISKKMG